MIESLKDLERLLKICRKQGVTEIKLGTVDLKFGDMPKDATDTEDTQDSPDGILTPEQLAFYSAGTDQANQ
jgi:hypothetical protein